MRKGDMRAFFALNRLTKSGKELDKENISGILELKPKDCTKQRWLAILRQTQRDLNNEQD